MYVTLIYAISYASAIAFIVLWRLSQLLALRAGKRWFSIFWKWAIHTLVVRRRKGSSDLSILAASIIGFFFVGNVIGSLIAVRSRSELSLRLAELCLVNFVILFVGGRTNIVIDKFLRWSMTDYYLFHRWIGRISIAEALIHGVLKSLDYSSALRKLDITVCVPRPRRAQQRTKANDE